MRLRTFYSTIVLSDIHLGTSHSKTVEVSNFLKSVNCRQSYHEDDGKAGNRSDLCSWQPR